MDLRETSDQPRHPWEIARMRFFRAVLQPEVASGGVQRVLDGGAGDAWFASQLLADLPPAATIRCWDEGYSDQTAADLRAALPARIELVRTRPDGDHDLVTLLDVLEHVEEDLAFLSAVVERSLRPGGWLLMSVPAWQGLFTQHDTFLHHHRRYAPAGARAVLQGAGLRIIRSGGLFHSLLAPRALAKLREQVSPPGAEDSAAAHQPAIAWQGGRWLTPVVLGALAADNAVSHLLARSGVDLPGLSWWALCQKPER